ncbi:MAG: hypothetical protein WAS33_17370, partial [Candidatus Promineifilaceae bacterium]
RIGVTIEGETAVNSFKNRPRMNADERGLNLGAMCANLLVHACTNLLIFIHGGRRQPVSSPLKNG